MSEPGSPTDPPATPNRFVLALVAWLAMVGVDLGLHAGVLAPLYDWSSPFMLAPEDAFVRIPAGYLALLLLAAGLTWLLPRLGIQDAVRGARAGALLGAVAWAAFLLGVWSISTASPQMLAAWWLGASVQAAVGAAVIGAAAGGRSLRHVAGWSAAALVIGLVVAIVLQSMGYAPAPSVI